MARWRAEHARTDAPYAVKVTTPVRFKASNIAEMISSLRNHVEQSEVALSKAREQDAPAREVGMLAKTYVEAAQRFAAVLIDRDRLTANSETQFSMETILAMQADRLARLQFMINSALPQKAAAIRTRLNGIETERTALGPTLDLEMEEAYRQYCSGNGQYRMVCDLLSARIATRELRLNILKSMETEAKEELAAVEQRNKALSRQLGRLPHRLT